MTIREFAAHSNMAVWYAHQAIDPATPRVSGHALEEEPAFGARQCASGVRP
jgi:hypothetical protein